MNKKIKKYINILNKVEIPFLTNLFICLVYNL